MGRPQRASLKQRQLSRGLNHDLELSRCGSGVGLNVGRTDIRQRSAFSLGSSCRAILCLEISPLGPRSGMALGGQASGEMGKQKISLLF